MVHKQERYMLPNLTEIRNTYECTYDNCLSILIDNNFYMRAHRSQWKMFNQNRKQKWFELKHYDAWYIFFFNLNFLFYD